jgi:hypothetical protein
MVETGNFRSYFISIFFTNLRKSRVFYMNSIYIFAALNTMLQKWGKVGYLTHVLYI